MSNVNKPKPPRNIIYLRWIINEEYILHCHLTGFEFVEKNLFFV